MPYTIHKQTQAEYQKQLNTGITPMMEKAQVFPLNNSDSTTPPLKIAKPKTESKKRSASTEDDEKFKRTKSVSEESAGPKIFDDVKWE